jgi:hypothetical protein
VHAPQASNSGDAAGSGGEGGGGAEELAAPLDALLLESVRSPKVL